MRRLSILAVLALTWALPAHATGTVLKPWSSPDRLALAVGGNYTFHSGEAENLPTFHKEWDAGAYLGYNILPSLDARLQGVRGFDNRTWRTVVGLSTPLPTYSGAPNLSISANAGYAFHAGVKSNLPKFPHEFEVGLAAAIPVGKNVLGAASTEYGLDNKTFRSSIGLRLVLKPVKEN